MKTTLITSAVSASSKLTFSKAAIDWTCNHDGTYSALIPIALPGVAGVDWVRTAKFTLASEATTNGKGKMRLMIKLTTAYAALDPSATQAAVQTGTPDYGDPQRSGGEISAHIVLSVPKALAVDMIGTNGESVQRNAFAQVVLTMRLLMGITPSWATAPLHGDGLAGSHPEGHIVDKPKDGMATPGNDTPNWLLVARDTTDGTLMTVGTGYDRPGLDITGCQVPNDLSDIFIRALHNMQPLDEDAEYQLPTVLGYTS